MAIVVKQNGGSGGGGGGSNPLTILVISDDAHSLGNGQVRDGATISLAALWRDTTIQLPQWTVTGPDGHHISTSSLTCDPSWQAQSCAQFAAATPGKYTVDLQATRDHKVIRNGTSFDVVTISTLETATGRLTYLRAHDVGSAYGPPDDRIDVEVVCKLDTKPDMAFGFQLRQDMSEPARRAMFDLLRDAYRENWQVTVEYSIVDLKHNGVVMRVALAR